MSTRFNVILIVLSAIVVCVGAYLHRNDPPYNPVKVKFYNEKCGMLGSELQQHPKEPTEVWIQFQAAFDSLARYDWTIGSSTRYQAVGSLYNEALRDSIIHARRLEEEQ